MNRTETIALLGHLPTEGLEKWKIFSEWLMDELDEYSRSVGYAYNDAVRDMLSKREGISDPVKIKDLGTLIYNAQKSRADRQAERDGFVVTTPEWIAAHEGETVEIWSRSLLGGQTLAKIRNAGGQLRMMKLRSRTQYFDAGARARPVTKKLSENT